MTNHLGAIFLAILAVESGPGLALDEIVRANDAAVTAINSLVVKGKYYQSNPKSSDPDALNQALVYTYRIHEGQARMTSDAKPGRSTEAGDRMGYSDETSGPGGRKSILGYDPSSPPTLGEYSLSKSHGFLAEPEPGRRPLGKAPFADLFLCVPEGGESYTLRELIAGATSARLASTPATSALGCYEIEVKRPIMSYRIYVDPALNYMMRKIENTGSGKNTFRGKGISEASEFRDYGDGVFLPGAVQVTQTEEGRPSFKIRYELQVISCNQAIPAEEFRLEFPEWLPVVDKRTGQIHRWGADGKPRLTFPSAEEHRKWHIPRLEQALRMQRSRGFPWYLVMGAVTIVLLAVLRRLKIRAAAANT